MATKALNFRMDEKEMVDLKKVQLRSMSQN